MSISLAWFASVLPNTGSILGLWTYEDSENPLSTNTRPTYSSRGPTDSGGQEKGRLGRGMGLTGGAGRGGEGRDRIRPCRSPVLSGMWPASLKHFGKTSLVIENSNSLCNGGERNISGWGVCITDEHDPDAGGGSVTLSLQIAMTASEGSSAKFAFF